MLSAKEVACKLGVSLSLVYQLCKDRQLKHFRLGAQGKRGSIRIEEAEVTRYLAERIQVELAPSVQFKHLSLR